MGPPVLGPEEELELREIPELQPRHEPIRRGERPPNVRAAATELRSRLKGAGVVHGVRTVDLISIPYPTRLALANTSAISSWLALIGRMVIAQFDDFGGARRTLVWEPLLARSLAESPFHVRVTGRRTLGLAGPRAPRQLCSVSRALADHGLEAASVDLVVLSDLRGHDLRRLVGTTQAIGNEAQPRVPMFPRARVLVQRNELGVLSAPHPFQSPAYVSDSSRDLLEDRLVALDGDVALGPSVALLATPGLTAGHQSLVLGTADGIWVVSGNGVASDCWQPLLSKIPGVRRAAEASGREVVLAPGAERPLDLYDSMVLERSLADASRVDPRWLTILPARELGCHRRQWPARPTFSHGGIDFGPGPGARSPGD